MKIVIASNNPHKIFEIQNIFQNNLSKQIEVISPSQIVKNPIKVEETGATLEDNAFLKAIAIFSATGFSSLADDTGLEIDALGNSPGVKSARYAGEYASDSDNRNKVLKELYGKKNRNAQFKTVICFHDGVRTLFSEGTCKGQILLEERGSGGFGYDSLFKPEGCNLSFAEMDLDAKNKISHRGIALQNLMLLFRKYYE